MSPGHVAITRPSGNGGPEGSAAGPGQLDLPSRGARQHARGDGVGQCRAYSGTLSPATCSAYTWTARAREAILAGRRSCAEGRARTGTG